MYNSSTIGLYFSVLKLALLGHGYAFGNTFQLHLDAIFGQGHPTHTHSTVPWTRAPPLPPPSLPPPSRIYPILPSSDYPTTYQSKENTTRLTVINDGRD